MYFGGFDYGYTPSRIKCLSLPSVFNKSQLKFDLKYTYNGREYVQHHRLITFEECTTKYIYFPNLHPHGYMTQDE